MVRGGKTLKTKLPPPRRIGARRSTIFFMPGRAVCLAVVLLLALSPLSHSELDDTDGTHGWDHFYVTTSLELGRDPRVLLLADNLDDASAEDLEREIAELEAAEKLLRANAQPAAAADAPTPKDEVQGSQPTAAADAPTPKDLAADEAHASDSAEDLDAADDLDSLEAELKSMEADAELVRQKLKAEDKKAKDAAPRKQQGEAKVDDAPTVVKPAADVADEAPIKDEAATRMQVKHEAPLQEEREVRAKPERTLGSADSDAVLTRLKSEHAEAIAQLRVQIQQVESEAEQRQSILLDEKRGLHEELQTLRGSQAAALKEVQWLSLQTAIERP